MPYERGTRVDRAGKRRGRGVAGWLGGQGREAGGGREGERGTQVVSPARSMYRPNLSFLSLLPRLSSRGRAEAVFS